ncbi:hypothetical protein COMNV_00236 [Commensalibacter sp. Nvir]|uniref:diacylglycerol kinase family protein n=1 Tax=Commensalibacter sp. Nvir TaxID=3069817 RepID=UPI002D4B45DC|nr:hypothetical protein COMNV_00236 [Commensalibacter sp. Nvir]
MIQNIALIKNPTSRLNRKENQEFSQFAKQWLGDNYCVPYSIDHVLQTVAELKRKHVQCILIDGGDGTVSRVLTGIYHAYEPDQFPYLVILPSGNTNLISKDIGFGLRGFQALQRIKILSEKQRLIHAVQHRHALKIEWINSSRPAVLGMFQGALAFTKATDIAHKPTIAKNFGHDLAIMVTILIALLKLILPKSRRIWLDGDLCGLKIGQNDFEFRNRFIFLATTLQKLSNGIWPFWGGNGNIDFFHYLSVDANPKKLLISCLALLKGKSPMWLRKNSSYNSGVAKEILLNLNQNIILDGEHYDTGNNHVVKLSIGPRFSFLRL